MKQIKCRSCKLNKDIFLRTGKHCVEDLGRFCPSCRKVTKTNHHGIEDEMFGETFECNECNNYIVYTTDNLAVIYKDEYYLSDDKYVIRDFESNSTSLCISGKEIIKLPFILDISNIEKLSYKFNTYTVFK